MRQRNPSPLQRYKKEMARVVFNARSSIYNDYGKRLIKETFKHFDPKWHNIIADDYPLAIEDRLLTDNGFTQWREHTDHLETEGLKKSWWLEIPQITNYLEQVHGLKTQS